MSTPLQLPSELTIYTVGELREGWAAWLAALDPGQAQAPADAAAVSEVDGAGLQMLLALSRSCAARAQPLVLQQPSATLQAACAALGLSTLLPAAGEPA